MFDKNYLWLKDNTIFLTKTGSFSYGTNIEGSDHDFKGIAFAKKDHYFGFNFDFNQYTLNDPDLTIFEFQKVIKLLADGNPNSLELLYTDESDHVFVSKLGQKLLDFRENFLSKALKERFLGYSKAQAYRLKLHRKHILNGEPKKPNRKDFGLPEKLSIPTNQYEAVSAQLKKQVDQWNPDFDPFSEAQKIWLQSKFVDMLSEINITQDTLWMAAARKLGYSDNFIEILNKEKQFEAEQAYFEKYQDWKKNRNPKRAALEAKSGMDLKHVYHCIRLCRMCLEILETGKVLVKRPDAEELIAIRTGSKDYSYDQFVDEISSLETKIKLAYDKSILPKEVNSKKINDFSINLTEEFFYGNNIYMEIP